MQKKKKKRELDYVKTIEKNIPSITVLQFG